MYWQWLWDSQLQQAQFDPRYINAPSSYKGGLKKEMDEICPKTHGFKPMWQTYEDFDLVLPVRNKQICNRSVLTKTDQLQTNLSSAESVFSMLQTLSLNTLRYVKTADEKQTNNRSADYLQRLQMICNTMKPKNRIDRSSLYRDFGKNLSWISHYWFVLRLIK